MAEIAVAGAIAILKRTISILGNLAAEEGARLLKLKEDIGWVEREMGYIQTYLRNADSIEEENENTVEADLVKDIRVLAYDVEYTVEKYFPLIARDKSMSVLGKTKTAIFGIFRRSDLVKEIEAIKRRVEDIRRVRETYETTVSNNGKSRIDIWEQRKHFLYTNESKIVGFDEHIKIMVSKIFDPNRHPVISIVGMPGLGKTTLAKKVLSSVKAHFDCSAMVYVSQKPDIRQLLLEMAKQVGLEDDKFKDNLEMNVRKHLEDKRYVIVFDDIWDSQAWDYLKMCIPNKCINGSKIIITSRKTEVGSQIGTVSSLYELTPLDKEDSMNLFQDLLVIPLQNTNVICDFHELESLGGMIVDKCGGVPLAIAAVAGLLLGMEATESEWKLVLKRMGQDEDKCSRILRLSYKDLPIELKPCFLYFGLFPEDYEVKASDIINMWVAEGFVQGKRDAEPEDVGRDYLNQLVARNMVQVSGRRYDGRVGTCRIHDLWHAFCIMVGTETSFFNTDESYPYRTTRVRRVIISADSEYEAGRINVNLKGYKCLRVLMVKSSSYLPSGFVKGIASLTDLKYLHLYRKGGYVHTSIPQIGNLKSLLTLDLRSFDCVKFPHEIWQMRHLRHILMKPLYWEIPYLSHILRHCGIGGKLDVPLSNLQTLRWVPGEAMDAEHLRGFPNLRKLGIYRPTNSMMKVLSDVKPISDKLVSLSLVVFNETPTDLSRYQSLCKLYFQSTYSVSRPRNIVMPSNLVKLTFHVFELDEDPIEIWKSLPKLKILNLAVVDYKKDAMVCSGGSEAFPQLEVLILNTCCDHSHKFVVEEHAMPKLKELTWVKKRDNFVRFEAPERILTKIFEDRLLRTIQQTDVKPLVSQDFSHYHITSNLTQSVFSPKCN